MLKIALTNRLVNVIAKKLMERYFKKRLGDDAKICINELSAEETDGRVKLKINAELDLSTLSADLFIHSL